MSEKIDPPIVATGTNGSVRFDGRLVVVSAKRSLVQSAQDERIPIDKITKIHTKPAGWRGGYIFFATGEAFDASFAAVQGRGGVLFTEKQQPDFVRLYRAVERRMAGEDDWARIDPSPPDPEPEKSQPDYTWWKWLGGGLLALVAVQIGWSAFDPEGYDAWMAEAAAERETEQQAEADKVRADLATYVSQADAAMEPCERGYAGLIDRMSGFSGSMGARTDLYQLADQVRFVCLERSSDLRAMDLPGGLSDDQERGAKAFRDSCQGSLDSTAIFAKAISQVAEYGLSPSRNSDVDRALDRVKGEVLQCSAAREAIEVRSNE